jgi:hypothetical protein
MLTRIEYRLSFYCHDPEFFLVVFAPIHPACAKLDSRTSEVPITKLYAEWQTSESYSVWPNLAKMFPQRGTIRRKLIHRESFRASVLAPTLATTRCEHVPDTRIAYFLARDVSVAPTGREHAYAAIAIMSSLVSLSTTGFISSVHSPCRFPACIS